MNEDSVSIYQYQASCAHMGLGIIMFIRILFGIYTVLIIGYVFGGFSKKPTLVVLFIAVNGLLMRFAFSRQVHDKVGCGYWKTTLPENERSK